MLRLFRAARFRVRAGPARAAGFVVDLEADTARPLLAETVNIAMRPVRTNSYDYARDTSVPDMRALGLRRTLGFLRVRPPAEAVMLGRAVGGCAQNLRALGAKGDFRSVYERLVEVKLPSPPGRGSG